MKSRIILFFAFLGVFGAVIDVRAMQRILKVHEMVTEETEELLTWKEGDPKRMARISLNISLYNAYKDIPDDDPAKKKYLEALEEVQP